MKDAPKITMKALIVDNSVLKLSALVKLTLTPLMWKPNVEHLGHTCTIWAVNCTEGSSSCNVPYHGFLVCKRRWVADLATQFSHGWKPRNVHTLVAGARYEPLLAFKRKTSLQPSLKDR